MTVTTTVLPASRPRAGQVGGEQRQQLVAGRERRRCGPRPAGGRRPRRGRGRGRAPLATTSAASDSGWVEPQPSLMLVPSGSHGDGVHVRTQARAGPRVPPPRRRRWRSRPPPACPVRSRPSSTGTQVLDVAVGARRARRDSRPTPWPTGGRDRGPAAARTRASSSSMAASVASGSLRPPAAKSLMPLSAKGLCEAETTAAGQPRWAARPGHPGRGQHAEVDDVGALARHARPTARPGAAGPSAGCRGRPGSMRAGRARAAARPRARTSSAPSSALATPRMPSVPNRSPTTGYRLEYCGALRAFFRPYFLLSFSRASRVRRPAFLRMARSSGLSSTSDRAMPRRMAPAWPDTPPPAMVASMS